MRECVIWDGFLRPDGYGHTSSPYKGTRYAHRAAYMQHHGIELAPRTVVRHICDNRACVNPLHLTVGTQQQNVQDCKDRGRRAEAAYVDWLTPAEVDYCVRNYIARSPTHGTRALGRLLRVPNEVVSLAVRNGISPKRKQ